MASKRLEDIIREYAERVAESVEKMFDASNTVREENIDEINKELKQIVSSLEERTIMNSDVIQRLIDRIEEVIDSSKKLEEGYSDRDDDLKTGISSVFESSMSDVEMVKDKDEAVEIIRKIEEKINELLYEKENGKNEEGRPASHVHSKKYISEIEELVRVIKTTGLSDSLDLSSKLENIIQLADEIETQDGAFETHSSNFVAYAREDTEKEIEKHDITAGDKLIVDGLSEKKTNDEDKKAQDFWNLPI